MTKMMCAKSNTWCNSIKKRFGVLFLVTMKDELIDVLFQSYNYI